MHRLALRDQRKRLLQLHGRGLECGRRRERSGLTGRGRRGSHDTHRQQRQRVATPPSGCVSWWAVPLLCGSHEPRRRSGPTPAQRGGALARSGDRRAYLSGPRRKEPRSTAERLLALETKFLLFWVGQERDSVPSRLTSGRAANRIERAHQFHG